MAALTSLIVTSLIQKTAPEASKFRLNYLKVVAQIWAVCLQCLAHVYDVSKYCTFVEKTPKFFLDLNANNHLPNGKYF